MNGRYLFDTNAIINYLRGVQPWVRFIDDAEMTERLASVITRMELLSWQGLSPLGESRVKEFLADTIVIPLEERVEATAIELRRSSGLKLPNAIITATAVAFDATLVTGDQRITKLNWPGLRAVTPA